MQIKKSNRKILRAVTRIKVNNAWNGQVEKISFFLWYL